MVGTERLLSDAMEALERVEAERTQTREQHQQAMALYDDEIRSLRAVVRALTPDEHKPRKKRSAAVQAGPKALDAVRAALKDGPLSQAQIVAKSGLNDGTVSYALRALTVELREVEPTGRLVESSREFRLTRAQAVA